MTDKNLGTLEKRVLRAMRNQSSMTVEQITAMLEDTGSSSVVDANAALARNHLVEPVPDGNGALRLTSEGAKLAQQLPDVEQVPHSGGGTSDFN